MHCHTNHNPNETIHKNSPPQWLYLCGLAAAGILIAVTVFKLSLSNVLFYGIILLCPLIHIFMMKNHGQTDENE